MRQPLQEWFNENQPDEDLIYRKGLDRQVFFVRDTLPSALCANREEYEQGEWVVISTHRSKSVVLPVFQIKLPIGLTITMRDNFYDWKVSVSARAPLCFDVMGLFDPSRELHPVYFEGFPREIIYGSYESDPSRFSVELRNDYLVFTLLWIVARTAREEV
jgi:hypothetical protein